jgi:hypothetical protein
VTPFEEHPFAWSALFALDVMVCAVALWMTFTEREPMADEFKCFWIERWNDAGGAAAWRRTDTGEVRGAMGAWGPGALCAEPEHPEHVHVRTPEGWVNLFSWQRTGDPRAPETFTARPSIRTIGANDVTTWHGELVNGVLRSVP